MREVKLANSDLVAVVDDDIFVYASVFTWKLFDNGYGNLYAATWDNHARREYFLHWLVMGIPEKGMVIDHINRNGLCNLRSNLRLCDKRKNAINTKTNSKNTTGHRCVYKVTHCSKSWKVQMVINGKRTSLGYFKEKEDAIKLVDATGIKLYGEYWRCECSS